MTTLHAAKTCELHIHLGGSVFADDLLELARDHYQQIDWSLFVNSFEQAYGTRPDPVALIRDALDSQNLDHFKAHYVYGDEDGGDFAQFQAKFNMALCVYRHWWSVLGNQEEIWRRVIERQRCEGLRYVEYRAMAPYDHTSPEAFLQFHAATARVIRDARSENFEARYLISLPRWAPLECYLLVQRLLDENEDLVPTVVGLDFCHFEEGYPPESTRAFFQHLRRDNELRPDRALDVAYHVGEVYFDKSLESAVRWCHEAAELGAVRLGHCTALGLDPEVAIARQPDAHEFEPVAERLAQIRYDLHYEDALARFDIAIDADALEAECHQLSHHPKDEPVRRAYEPDRLGEIRRRQDFVLSRLSELGIVVETCPTSNLRIGAVPSAADHPVHRFLASDVNLAIGADDPGVFDCTLADEVDWVQRHTDLDAQALQVRLADPRNFRCGLRRAWRGVH
jgi:adenosine deaminase